MSEDKQSIALCLKNIFRIGDVLPTGNLTFPIRHAGQYYDAEVNIFYNYFRDYDPITGRYVESDPIGLDGGLNTYGYVGGNVLNLVDPRGLLNEVVKKCVCDALEKNNYQYDIAQGYVVELREKSNWDNPNLRPCENYLYAYSQVFYGDMHYLKRLAGIQLHNVAKPIRRTNLGRELLGGSSPYSWEAHQAQMEGVADAVINKDWKNECKDCK